MDILQKVQLVNTMVVFSELAINKNSESLLLLLYRWNSTTYTFFTRGQEVSPSLKDVYEILRFPLFGDGDVANIPVSSKEAKIMKFLEDAVKKTLKKRILITTRKGKAPSEEVLEDINVRGDKGSRANFLDGSGTSGGSMQMACVDTSFCTS